MSWEVQVGYWEHSFCHGKGCPALAQLPKAGVESPSLGGFSHPMDVALGDVGQWWPWAVQGKQLGSMT